MWWPLGYCTGLGIEVEVQEKQFTFIVTLFIQKYKWVLAKCQGSWLKFWGVALILFVASCYKNQYKLRLDGQLGSRTDLTCLTIIVVYFSIYFSMVNLWKYVSLVVGGLDSGLRGLGFRSGLIIVLCS